MAMSSSQKSFESDRGRLELSQDEQTLLQEQLATKPTDAGYFALFRYATAFDLIVYYISMLASAAGGIGTPMMMIAVGTMTGTFSDFLRHTTSPNAFTRIADQQALRFVYIGVGQLAALTIGIYGLNYVGERVTTKLRKAYLDAVLRQNIAFFDHHGAGEVAIRISNDMTLVQDGISQKIGLILFGLAGFLSAIIVAFVKNWRLALVLLCVPVAIILTMGILGSMMKQFQNESSTEYAKSGTFAQEVISSIRSVNAYSSQARFLRIFEDMLVSPANADFQGRMALGALMSIMMFIMNASYGLGFWQGNRFLQQGYSSTSDTVTVLFTAGLAGVMIGHSAPFIAAVAQAGTAATRIFATIERHSPIDPLSQDGKTIDDVTGAIEFKDVKFVYPSRPDRTIFDGFHLTIPAGKTVAIVGPSGSGKSTIFSLIERLYPLLRGSITLDGCPIDELNTRWLRSQIGAVSQDNFLFNTSIYDNIAYGLGSELDKLSDTETMKLVEQAAKTANAHSFIKELPNGYHTEVGERGSRLSGGQRQRVAIARAIVSNPKILLLDEATAALDSKSERLVQEALYSAAKGRTTVVIAHRLSTVQKADWIVVIENGRVTEQGTHSELIAAESTYASLVRAQQLRHREDEDESEITLMKQETTASNFRDSINNLINAEDAQKKVHGNSILELAKLVWDLNKQERYHLIIGVIAGMVAGAGFPILGIFFGNGVISFTDATLSEGGHSQNFWSLMLLMLGLVLFLAYSVQGFCFAVAGAALAQRARSRAFAAIMCQDMAFFDRKENSSGSLTAFLSTEATKLTGISGNNLGAILNAIITLVSAIAVGCSFGWKLGLVATAMTPIYITCGFVRHWIVSKTEQRMKATTDAAALASEAVTAIRTVAALMMETTINRQYAASIRSEYDNNLLLDFASALTYALTQSMVILVNGLLFWYGGTRLIGTGEYTVEQFFICYMSVVFGAQAAGSVFSYAGEIEGAKDAAAQLKHLIESKPSINVDSSMGEKPHEVLGDIDLQNVNFAYPTAPHHVILNDFSLAARQGQFIALVGGSGSGRSTVLNLIERFYDPTSGSVLADMRDIRTLHLSRFRSEMALVEQEAPLIGSTIRECIISDNENVDDSALEEACKAANIFDFVVSLPEGFNTLTGSRGNRLSGGQKQRLIIAKALLRDPKILLLDEATSALDSESERLVQRALESASQGRTTIAVAHRLSSISHADRIFVFDHGRIVEHGNHDELMSNRSRYFDGNVVDLFFLNGWACIDIEAKARVDYIVKRFLNEDSVHCHIRAAEIRLKLAKANVPGGGVTGAPSLSRTDRVTSEELNCRVKLEMFNTGKRLPLGHLSKLATI
ncbi:hypothetical protein G7Y89_g1486 [Cudoniella acicularis]|uniref:P-loop containing nucleoside triphosphate hydrolase protein n=1 Tax=Cudoniella acicularis TaxID=354080 RepID=A0A8H4RX54_9HELO|nr:hypothetical protein G7Y89_g1486 [Cudoniella acicularis]